MKLLLFLLLKFDILVDGLVRVLLIRPWPLRPFSCPVLQPRLCRVAFSIFSLKYCEKMEHKLANHILKSLLGNFQDGGLRARLLRDNVKQPFPRDLKSRQIFNYFLFLNHGIKDRSLTSNSLGCCCFVIKFDPPHVSYQ